MTHLSDHYRDMASKARSNADAATLPNVKQLHSRSADLLEQIVLRMDYTAEVKTHNDAAKKAALPI